MALPTDCDVTLAERPMADGPVADEIDGADVLELAGDMAVDAALAAVNAASANSVAIRFGAFADGRGFSLALQLRRAGFTGKLTAVGDVLPDQAAFLQRVGFDDIASDSHAGDGRFETARGFTRAYQPSADGATPAYRRRQRTHHAQLVAELNQRAEGASPRQIIDLALATFNGEIAQLSSFGAEAGVGLALVAQADRRIPVLFIDTHRHFPQTLAYKDELVARLGLTNVVTIEPDPEQEARFDADDDLYKRDGQACCRMRKVEPLERVLTGYLAVITGRKRYHGGGREHLEPFEFDGVRIKVNPFASLTAEAFSALVEALDVPPHPLVVQGYPSIGCWPCTAPANGQTGDRAGRWAGQDRSECGIFDADVVARAQAARRNVRQLL